MSRLDKRNDNPQHPLKFMEATVQSSYESLKKLGWLSAYSRQVLLTRHLARLSTIEFVTGGNSISESSLLLFFRLCTLCPAENIKDNSKLSVPYHPSDRPEHYQLKSKTAKHLSFNLQTLPTQGTLWSLSVGLDPLAADYPFTNEEHNEIGQGRFSINHSAFTKESNTLNQFLFHEVDKVGKGISLTSKDIADRRCSELWNYGLFAGLPLPETVAHFLARLDKEPVGKFTQIYKSWFLNLLEGKPDWAYWDEITRIKNSVWDAGPEKVAAAIERIQAAQLRDRTPMIEDMVFDEDTRTFKTVPTPVDSPDLFKVSLERAEFAFSLALGGNGLSEMCYEAKILNHTFQTCRDDPQNVEMNFMQVAGSLRGKIETGELPESDEIKGLGDTLFQASLDIRATHPAIAEARAKRAQRAVAEASPEQKAALADALPVLRAISDEKLAAETDLDFGQMLNTSIGAAPNSAPPLPPADAAYRIANRAAKMSLLTKSSEVAKKIDGSGGYKATRIGTTLYTVVNILLKIIGF